MFFECQIFEKRVKHLQMNSKKSTVPMDLHALTTFSTVFFTSDARSSYILRKYVASVCSHSMSFQIDIKQPIK